MRESSGGAVSKCCTTAVSYFRMFLPRVLSNGQRQADSENAVEFQSKCFDRLRDISLLLQRVSAYERAPIPPLRHY